MALLKIIKLAEGVWKHWSDKDGFFALTRLYAKVENEKFLIVEYYGAKRRNYLVTEIEVYNIVGTAETFSNFDDLQIRLKELNYIGYDANYSGGSVDTTANHFKGNYNIVTNTPALADATGSLNDEYQNTVVGTRDFGSGNITVGVNDILMHNGSEWFLKVNNNQSGGGGTTLRTFTCYFGINQNVAATPTGNTQWFRKDAAQGNNVTSSFTLQTSLDVSTTFATHSVLGACHTLPFQAKIKSVHARGWTNTSNYTGVDFVVLKSKETGPNIAGGVSTISNGLIIARETIQISASGFGNGFVKEFASGSLTTTTLPAGSDIRLVFKNFNLASNMFDTIITVEFEEVI